MIECRTCHTEMPSFRTYTCYACHDAAEMRAEHIDEGVREIRNCVGCHATGRDREGPFREDRRDDRGRDDDGGRGRGRGGRGV